MKSIFTLLALIFSLNIMYAQTIVFDEGHFRQVLDNQAVRTTAENIHQNNLGSIKNSINSINANVSSVVLVQDVIYRSLTEVNEGLKDGLMVKNMTCYVSDIIRNCNKMVDVAKDEPYLLLFAEKQLQWSKARVELNPSGIAF